MSGIVSTLDSEWEKLGLPVARGSFITPPGSQRVRPVCGHLDGLQIGLAPMPGPRGLIRIYAPYLDHPLGRMINYIAIEPIPKGETRRGFSELEFSDADQTRGKRLWFGDDYELTDENMLTRIEIEEFNNGAHVSLTVEFCQDKPYEVSFTTSAYDDSVELDYVILTATMGNYARLRRLMLADEDVVAADLWPDFSGDGFAPHRRFVRDRLSSTGETGVVIEAISDELDPTSAVYSKDTAPPWRYQGRSALQYWLCQSPPDELFAQVNGRTCYWASQSPIPGGISFENLELVAPFVEGQQFTFGVRPLGHD